jgi:hypothetical protein
MSTNLSPRESLPFQLLDASEVFPLLISIWQLLVYDNELESPNIALLTTKQLHIKVGFVLGFTKTKQFAFMEVNL